MVATLDLVDVLDADTWAPLFPDSDHAPNWGTLYLAPRDDRIAAMVDLFGRVTIAERCRKSRRRNLKPKRRANGTWFVVRHLGHWVQDILAIEMVVINGRRGVPHVILGPTRPRSSK